MNATASNAHAPSIPVERARTCAGATEREKLWAFPKRPDRMAAELLRKMPLSPADPRTIPAWLRWTVLLWLMVWIPTYWHTWGSANFLHLCDIAVILTCIGLWTSNALLLSSQAVSSLLIDFAWGLDAGWKLFVGHHLIGGTDYLFDPHYPLGVRLLSLFHLVLPFLLLWALHRIGYDRRGFALQTAIALAAFTASRFTSPLENINFAFQDPFLHRAWGPAPVHVVISVLFLVVVAYLPAHLALKWLFPPPHEYERIS